jgi:hypothetical protein
MFLQPLLFAVFYLRLGNKVHLDSSLAFRFNFPAAFKRELCVAFQQVTGRQTLIHFIICIYATALLATVSVNGITIVIPEFL